MLFYTLSMTYMCESKWRGYRVWLRAASHCSQDQWTPLGRAIGSTHTLRLADRLPCDRIDTAPRPSVNHSRAHTLAGTWRALAKKTRKADRLSQPSQQQESDIHATTKTDTHRYTQTRSNNISQQAYYYRHTHEKKTPIHPSTFIWRWWAVDTLKALSRRLPPSAYDPNQTSDSWYVFVRLDEVMSIYREIRNFHTNTHTHSRDTITTRHNPFAAKYQWIKVSARITIFCGIWNVFADCWSNRQDACIQYTNTPAYNYTVVWFNHELFASLTQQHNAYWMHREDDCLQFMVDIV